MRYVLRRLGFFVLTLWAALTLNFFIPRFMPGSPLQALRDRTHNRLSPAALRADAHVVRVQAAPERRRPVHRLPRQHGHRQLGHVDRRDAGRAGAARSSVRRCPGRSVWSASPRSSAFLLGSLIGIVAGWRRGGRFDSILPPVFVVTSALPYFWVGLLLILVFSVWTAGCCRADFNYDNTCCRAGPGRSSPACCRTRSCRPQPSWSPRSAGGC